MKTIKILLGVLTIILIAGCTYNGKHHTAYLDALAKTDEKILEDTRYMNDITVKALSRETNHTPMINLARSTSGEAQRLIGVSKMEPFDIDAWASNHEEQSRKLFAQFDVDTRLLELKGHQQEKADQYAAVLVDKGMEAETARNKTIWWHFWEWTTTTLMIAGFIALCVFTPVGPMVLGVLIRAVIGFFPRLIKTFGLVSTDTLSKVVKGVGNHRWELKQMASLPEDKQPTYTPTEVLSMLDKNMDGAISDDTHTLKVVNTLRKDNNVD